MTTYSHDVAIIGAGLIGLTLGTALAAQGLSVAIIEKLPFDALNRKTSDGRASAIAAGSRIILSNYGLWDAMQAEAGPINDIRITDGNCPIFLHFDHTEVGTEPLGHMVENHHIMHALLTKIATLPNLQLFCGTSIVSSQCAQPGATLILEDGAALRARLMVAADGKNSPMRDQAGIPTVKWNYRQTGIVCTVQHDKHHQGIAQERFLPSGPFAILPLKDGYHSSLVWTEESRLAPLYLAMNDEDFLFHIRERFGDYLGTVTLASNRFSYPLSVCYAEEYCSTRLALAGDAAHAIHPIAGQGFNLGLRDVEALANTLVHYHGLGIDIGSALVLEHYQRLRRADNLAMIAITDSLNHLFSNNIAPIRHLRRLGLAAVSHLPKLQQFFMHYAMGTK